MQERYRGNSTKLDLNPGPGKGKGQWPKKMKKLTPIIVADLGEDEETDPTIFVSLDEDGQKDQGEEHTREEEPPQSPPEEEKGNFAICIHPKVTSPTPPPEDDDWETKSLPGLVKLGDMISKATPVYEGFWKNSDLDILSRLDAASAELKDK